MLRSRCGQIKAKLLSLILKSSLETLENDRTSPVANLLRDAVSRGKFILFDRRLNEIKQTLFLVFFRIFGTRFCKQAGGFGGI